MVQVGLGFVPTEGETTSHSFVVFFTLIGLAWGCDFFVNAYKAHTISVTSAATWTVIWGLVSCGFAVYLKVAHPNQPDWWELFMAGYFLELALSVDNLVIFIIVFGHFGIHEGTAQHRLLLYGIVGCILTRIGFASLGENALEGPYEPFLDLALAALMFYLSFGMLMKGEEEEEEELDYDSMTLVKAVKYCFPFYPNPASATSLFVNKEEVLALESARNEVKTEKGREIRRTEAVQLETQMKAGSTRWATPGMFCLCVLLGVDLMFSFDSAGAILAITHEPLIIISSMLCGVMGLRSLFHLIQALKEHFQHLTVAISATLAVIGLQLAIETFEGFKKWEAPSFLKGGFERAVHAIGFNVPWWHDKTEDVRAAVLFGLIICCLFGGFTISYCIHGTKEAKDTGDSGEKASLLESGDGDKSALLTKDEEEH